MKFHASDYFASLDRDEEDVEGSTLRGIPGPGESDSATPPKRSRNGDVAYASGQQDMSFGFHSPGFDGFQSEFAIHPFGTEGNGGGLMRAAGGLTGNGNNAFTMAYARPSRPMHGKPDGNSRPQYYKDGMPVIQELKWGKLQANVPVIAPYTERPAIKNQILEKAVAAIERAHASWHDKVDALLSLFEATCPGARTVAALAILDLNRYNSPAFRFHRLEARAQDGTALDTVNAVDPDDFPGGFRTNVQWFQIQLIVQPRNIQAHADLGIDPSSFPIEETATVFVGAPKINGELPEFFTPAMLNNQAEHRNLVAAYALANHPFTLAKMQGNSANGIPEARVFETWISDIKARTMYQAVAQAIKSQYVGKLEGLLSVAMRLQQIRPTVFNPDTRMMEYQRVNDIYKRYQQILQEIDPANPGPDIPDLANQFFHSLSGDLQKRVYDAVPQGAPMGLADNIQRLHVFKLACEKEEGNLAQIVKLVKGVSPGRRTTTPVASHNDPNNTTPGRTFATMRQPEFGYSPSTDMQALKLTPAPFTGYSNNQKTHSGLTAAYCLDIGNEAMTLTLPADLARDAEQGTNKWASHTVLLMATMSAAEQALADASGTRFPRTCWGCDAPGHTFRDCPHKSNKDVANNFFKKIREMKQARQERDSQWRSGNGAKQQGYMTTQIYDFVQKIADPDTTPADRTRYLQNLASKVDYESPKLTRNKQSGNKGPMQFTYFLRQEDSDTTTLTSLPRKTKGVSFAMVTQQTPELQFSVNATLAFISIPIGTSLMSGTELKGLYDTGGCCTMGWYAYHWGISQRHPEIVKAFHELEKYRYEPIAIGGIDGHVKITHLIEYYLPYDDGNGNFHTLLVGLVDQLPLNTIYGLPLIIKANMKADFTEMLVHSNVLDDEFKLTMERPTLIPIEELDHKGHLKHKTYANIKADYSSSRDIQDYEIIGDIEGSDPQHIGSLAA